MDMFAPTQHEVHQERYEGCHEHHLVNAAEMGIDEIHHRRTLGPDAHLRHHHRGGRKDRGWRNLRRLPAASRRRSLLLRLLLRLLLLAEPLRHHQLVDLLFHRVHAFEDLIDELVDRFPVFGDLLDEPGNLRVHSQARQVDDTDSGRAHEKTRQRPRQTQPHQ